MKMTGGDYKLLQEMILRVVDRNRDKSQDETRAGLVARVMDNIRQAHPAVKDVALAVRWRIFATAMALPHALKKTMFHGMMGLRGKLYAYLDDEHIDTALRKIFREL